MEDGAFPHSPFDEILFQISVKLQLHNTKHMKKVPLSRCLDGTSLKGGPRETLEHSFPNSDEAVRLFVKAIH